MCPLSLEIMERPVRCADGKVYEEAEIRRWLEISNTSPCTNEPLSDLHLEPARDLYSRILEWKKRGL